MLVPWPHLGPLCPERLPRRHLRAPPRCNTPIVSFATTMGRQERFGANCSLLQGASFLVYYSEFLQSTIGKVPGHPFAGILLVNNPALLGDLKEFVKIKPSPQISTPTGIPPHVHHAKLTASCLTLCKETANYKLLRTL